MTLTLEARTNADDIIIGDTPKAKRRCKRLADFTPAGRLWKHRTLRDIIGIVDASARDHDYRAYYTNDLSDHVARICADDIARFEYAF